MTQARRITPIVQEKHAARAQCGGLMCGAAASCAGLRAIARENFLRLKSVVRENARTPTRSILARSTKELIQPSCRRAAPSTTKTFASCGTTPPQKSLACRGSSGLTQRIPSPEFQRVAPCAARSSRATRASFTGFISVSGQCAARSALSSDQRKSKRSSGGVAATEHLHAPMNSPSRPSVRRLLHPRSVARH